MRFAALCSAVFRNAAPFREAGWLDLGVMICTAPWTHVQSLLLRLRVGVHVQRASADFGPGSALTANGAEEDVVTGELLSRAREQ